MLGAMSRRDSGIGALAARIGRGLVAGAIGTAAMTMSSTVEQRARGREASTAPADAAMKVLGIAGFCDDGTRSRFSTLVHWGYGTGWGVPRALLDHAGLTPAAATAAHGAALWGSEQVMLPALGVAPPLWEWGAVEVAIDAGHHLVYAVATAVAYEALRG
jgi:hypothetical protein